MEKININSLKPNYNWSWTGCSFGWELRDGEHFSFENEDESYVEYIIPEWQRGHVWTEEQQIAYIEYCLTAPLQGGSATELILAEIQSGHGENYSVKVFLVDGLQRTTAVKRFLKGEITAFGRKVDDYLYVGRFMDFRVHKLQVKSEQEAMKLYLALNGTGTPHTKEELNRVKSMLEGK